MFCIYIVLVALVLEGKIHLHPDFPFIQIMKCTRTQLLHVSYERNFQIYLLLFKTSHHCSDVTDPGHGDKNPNVCLLGADAHQQTTSKTRLNKRKRFIIPTLQT
jgi:hypothetical protein